MHYVASSLVSRDGTHAHCSMNIKYGVYSRAATITPDGRYVRRLFEGGYYSKCGIYSRKYGTLLFTFNYNNNNYYYVKIIDLAMVNF